MHSLPVFLRLNGREIILLGDGDAATAKRQLLDRAGGVIVDEESDAPLAIVAIEDDDQALAAINRLKARGILVNAVDRLEHCDFTLPAIVDRSPVIIAIGTGGASAGLAKALRIRLEAALPSSLGRLAEALQSARQAMRERWPDARQRRVAIDYALMENGALDPLQDYSSTALDNWLASDAASAKSEVVRLAIASDNPDELTLRQARLLGQADMIYHDASIALDILARGRADAPRLPIGDLPSSSRDGLILVLERA